MEKRAKGNIIVATRRFVETELDADKRTAVMEALPATIRDVLPGVSRGDWCPREYVSAMWAALHHVEPDDEGALALLDRCGRFIGHDATNTFLRLLVRLLTPSVFARKFPRIWTKDFDFGRVEARVADKELVIGVLDIEGFDYFAHTAAGWFSHAMGTMGCTGVRAAHDVTLAEPGPADVRISLTWD